MGHNLKIGDVVVPYCNELDCWAAPSAMDTGIFSITDFAMICVFDDGTFHAPVAVIINFSTRTRLFVPFEYLRRRHETS